MNLTILNEKKHALITSYFCGSPDTWAYNIAKNFKKAIEKKKWSMKDGFSFVTNPSKVGEVVKNLYNHDVLLLTKEKSVNGRTRRYFKINPNILILLKPLYQESLKAQRFISSCWQCALVTISKT